MTDGSNKRDDLFSKSIRAGKRTYFFDVKATKGNDFYITITESKRKYTHDGRHSYEKHKLFLYKEDFEKFIEGLHETVDRIEALRSSNHFDDEFNRIDESDERSSHENSPLESDNHLNSYTNIEFDDLDDLKTD